VGDTAMENMPDDRSLISELKGGNIEALGPIYDRYKCHLLSVAINLLGDGTTPKDIAHDAEDVVHDAFVSFAGSAHHIKLRKGTLKGYLTMCVVNQIRDRMRRYATRTARAGTAVRTDPAPGSPIEEAINTEESQSVQHGLARLPYEQREVAILHALEEMTFREIAKTQPGVSINTVKSRWRYARQALEAQLNITPSEPKDQ
jgi:RNA polymerase sigma factor (sigma-70 family)